MNKMITGFNSAQLGFKHKTSLALQLIAHIDEFSATVDSGDFTAAVYFDFFKAFDSVPYCTLIPKLSKYGLVQEFVKFLLYKFSNKYKCVQTLSDTMPISSRVPQGTNFGRLLFVLYNDDISNSIDCPVSLYADDRKLGNRNNDNLLLEIALFLECSPENHSTIHQTRNNIFVFNSRETTLLLFLVKWFCLGLRVLTWKDFKWNTHISYLCSKTNSALHFLRRTVLFLYPEV